ncbi:metallophosphoesterase [Candidatus Laterigemmans baculatus]|uniref:metallophosphoesterase n=1 Tax=Candidatus Laterigemmans baculatus TaxID=2770505 RepID=UPI0013DCE335|nr:metallophosphoesterase [Candidatus Laterigemmans baculatus]
MTALSSSSAHPLTRRAFLQDGSLFLAAASGAATAIGTPWAASRLLAETPQPAPQLQIGLVTDLHYADRPPAGTRFYRETPSKLAEAGDAFRVAQPNFLVELGDFIDAADTVAEETEYLRKIHREFASISDARHHVLGNHCVFTLTKQEFLDVVEQPRSYYAFDAGNFHFVVLDSCFRSDGQPYGRKNFEWTDPNIPADELEWLAADLQSTSKKTIVFAHQRLDVSNHYGVKNAPAVRQILERSGNVLAVFQGHSHRNDYNHIAGIHYVTLVAMVEGTGAANNAFSLLNVFADGTLRLDGFKKQQDYSWAT